MQRVSTFSRIAPKLYQLGKEPAYVYLPEKAGKPAGKEAEAGGTETETEMGGVELYRRGGLFIYLRYPVERFDEPLLSLAAKYHGRATTLFLDNGSAYLQNWKGWNWSLQDVGIKNSRILTLYEYDLLVPREILVEVDEEGIHFQRLLFGREKTEACREAVLFWNGEIRFVCRAGKAFMKETHIRYVLECSDDSARRHGVVICDTGEPRLEARIAGTQEGYLPADGQMGTADGEGGADSWVQANLCWNINKETTFDFDKNTILHFFGYPAIEMETCSCRFARGITQYYLAISGEGHFLDSADVSVGSKGCFRISRGDRVEVAILPEGYLGEEKKCADVSVLKIQSPFYASGIEMEGGFAVPVFPSGNDHTSQCTKRKLEKKVQKTGAPAYHRNVWFSSGCFETCIRKREILWYNLYGTERGFPGIALCYPGEELAQALMMEESFVALDYRARQFFAIPYTIDSEALSRAVQMGYPQEKRELLMKYYPKGQVFLGEESFKRGILQADCPYTEELGRACHHYRVSVEGQALEFAPESWERQRILLAVKQGRTHSLQELVEEAGTWSFPSEDKEAAQRLLQKICGKAQETVRESVVRNPAWEGSLVVCAGTEQERSSWLLALEAKTGAAVLYRIQEDAASI